MSFLHVLAVAVLLVIASDAGENKNNLQEDFKHCYGSIARGQPGLSSELGKAGMAMACGSVVQIGIVSDGCILTQHVEKSQEFVELSQVGA